jgi:hypothetical protein
VFDKVLPELGRHRRRHERAVFRVVVFARDALDLVVVADVSDAVDVLFLGILGRCCDENSAGRMDDQQPNGGIFEILFI